jgi:hypothetical protein
MPKSIKSLYYVLICLVPINNYGQTKLKIRSAVDNSILSYSTIVNLTKNIFFSANELGEIILNATKGDTIKISYVGHNSTNYLFEGKEEKTIILFKDTLLLKTVTVSSCKKFSKIKVDNYTTDDSSLFGGFMMGASNEEGKAKVAMLLKSPKTNSYLKEFTFWLKKNLSHAPDYAIQNPYIISVYDVDDSTNLPGNLISDKPIFYFPKKAGKQTIDFKNKLIKIPDNGIYICFQAILDEKYQWKSKWIDREGNGDTIYTTLFGGVIEGRYTKTAKIAFLDLKHDKWISKNNSRADMKYKATFLYCKE